MEVRPVQIPLWTIVTQVKSVLLKIMRRGSDSSMDDCNLPARKFRHFPEICSDSSMDDCNGTYVEPKRITIRSVQIPLWTIVTLEHEMELLNVKRFRFLYGRL